MTIFYNKNSLFFIHLLSSGHFFRVFLFLIILFFHSVLIAQGPPRNFGQNSSSNNLNQSPQNDEYEGPDSTVYNYFYTENIYSKFENNDTLADIKFLQKNTISENSHPHISTGNLGASTLPLIYNQEIKTGFNTGYNQYKLYHINLQNFKFYEQNRPLADVYFSQLGGQDNIQVAAAFSRNFDNGLSLSLNYHRISQQGFYNGQDTKSTAFGIGLRYQSKLDRYNALLIFTHNANSEANLGGISQIDDLKNDFKRNIAVILNESKTRQQERELAFIQYLRLNSAKNKEWRLYIKNDLIYKPSYYNYQDNNVPDSIYNQFYQISSFDNRGIRRYLDVSHISNGFFINGERNKGLQGKIGLIFDYYSINNQPVEKKITDLTATFDGKIPIYKGLEIDSKAKLGLLNNIGNFDIKGNVKLDLTKYADLNGGIELFRSQPSFNTSYLVINELTFVDTTYQNPFGTILYAQLSLPKLNFSAKISQSVISNPIFWNLQGKPEQSSDVYSLTYLNLMQNIRLWRFHFDNQIHFQLQNSNIYPIPQYFSTHQAYYVGSWFKKVMEINIGIDARLIGDYNGPAYQPLFGEYHLSTTNLPFYPAANLFFIAKVSAFRAKFVMENFGQYFNSNPDFDVINHPQFEPKLRFAIQWLLKD